MTTSPLTFDPTAPFYAWIGAADLAVETLRGTAADVRERDLKALAARARSQFSSSLDELVDELQKDLGSLPKTAQARLEKLPKELKTLPKRLEALVEDARDLPKSAQARFEDVQGEANAFRSRFESILEGHRITFVDFVEEYVEAFEDLAVRGRALVAKLRDGSISGDVEIINPDAEVVKDVSPVVERAAAEAAAEAMVVPAAQPAMKKAPARKPAADKATGTKKPIA